MQFTIVIYALICLICLNHTEYKFSMIKIIIYQKKISHSSFKKILDYQQGPF